MSDKRTPQEEATDRLGNILANHGLTNREIRSILEEVKTAEIALSTKPPSEYPDWWCYDFDSKFNEDTLFKVYEAFIGVGIKHHKVEAGVNECLNRGILFREIREN